MSQEKNTYFINISTGEISKSSTDSPWNFQVDATDDEITALRELFDSNYSNEVQGFFRAHVPYVQYHHDRENDAYDETMVKIYQMIYQLTDGEGKKHIESMGILDE